VRIHRGGVDAAERGGQVGVGDVRAHVRSTRV
jgi:hypothetical protein